MDEQFEWLSRLSVLKAAGIGLLLAAAIELVTVALRFGFDLQTTRETAWLAPFTLGFRIHHGYVGLVLLLVVPFLKGGWRNVLLALGIALLVSDLVHHFIVLKAATGDAQFHLRYPEERNGA